jgi:hypothetical protein
MPTALRSGPYRFYFYSHENDEPPHIHVDRDDSSAKFWLQPVALARNLGFAPVELRRERLVSENQALCWRRGMSTREPSAGERIKDVRVSDDSLSVDLLGRRGRRVRDPLARRG